MAVNRAASSNVQGLSDLRRELKKLDDADSAEWRKALGKLNFEVASFVVGKAKPRMSALPGPGHQSAASLVASKSAVSARVALGGARAPFAEGVEFGAGQNVERQTARRVLKGWNQFQPWRGNDANAGYALFPTIRNSTEEIVDKYGDAMERLLAAAFPD